MADTYLSISAAAKLMGMKRAILQHKIHTGEIESFEGRVRITSLEKACPTAKAMDTSQVLERMEFIKDNAYTSRLKTAHVPDAHVLLGQIKKLRMELKLQHQQNLKYLNIISELRDKLQQAEVARTDQQQETISQLLALISSQISQPLTKNALPKPL